MTTGDKGEELPCARLRLGDERDWRQTRESQATQLSKLLAPVTNMKSCTRKSPKSLSSSLQHLVWKSSRKLGKTTSQSEVHPVVQRLPLQ